MNEREYLKLRKDARDEYHRKLGALDTVWRMSNGTAPPNPPSKSKVRSIDGERGNLVALVNQAVDAIEGEFNAKDVMNRVRAVCGKEPDRSAVSHTLKRLEQSGKLVTVSAGSGRKGSIYARHATPAPAPNLATDQQQQEIRTVARKLELDAQQFRENVLQGRFGVSRLAELDCEQAKCLSAELMKRLEAKEAEIAG